MMDIVQEAQFSLSNIAKQVKTMQTWTEETSSDEAMPVITNAAVSALKLIGMAAVTVAALSIAKPILIGGGTIGLFGLAFRVASLVLSYDLFIYARGEEKILNPMATESSFRGKAGGLFNAAFRIGQETAAAATATSDEDFVLKNFQIAAKDTILLKHLVPFVVDLLKGDSK